MNSYSLPAPPDGQAIAQSSPLLYFDHNATTPVAPEVADAYREALLAFPGNASSSHRAGQVARQQIEQARKTLADALRVSPADVVFTSGGTESNNLALLGMVCHVSERPHIVTTAIEHPAVSEPVRFLQRQGADVTVVRVSPSGLVDAQSIAEAVTDRTALVSLMHANNETGHLQPVAEVAEMVRQRRRQGQPIYLHCDGVQAFGKIAVDLTQLGVDLYSVSAHKLYGPKGVGALFVRKNTPLQPLLLGGRHERGRRAGTENVPGVVAFARAAELLQADEGTYVASLRDRFEQLVLATVENVERNGTIESRLPNTSNLLFRGVSGESLLIALDMRGMAVSTGAACSSGSLEPSHVLLAAGRTASEARSSVRFSFGRYNSLAEVEQLATAVAECVQRLRSTAAQKRQLVPA